MKISLLVKTTGKMEGKTIPITLAQFLIGRDPECHLRPASALISKRHCAILVRNKQVFVRDFDSTNGTSINEQPLKGEAEIHNGDILKVGPLHFKVQIEGAVPVDKPTPAPASKTPPPASKPAAPAAAQGSGDDDDVAAMLLALGDDGASAGAGAGSSGGVPEGSTVFDMKSPLAAEPDQKKAEAGKEPKDGKDKAGSAKAAQQSTSSAAKAILEKYMRRPRS